MWNVINPELIMTLLSLWLLFCAPGIAGLWACISAVILSINLLYGQDKLFICRLPSVS